jgi:hypothetical protein
MRAPFGAIGLELGTGALRARKITMTRSDGGNAGDDE